MKRIVFFVFFCICLNSCGNDNPAKDVEKYINDNAEYLTSLEIIDVSEKDSVYFPYDLIKNVTAGSIAAKYEMTEKRREAWERKDKKEILRLLREASNNETLKLVRKDFLKLDSKMKLIGSPQLFNSDEKSTIGVHCDYRLNGEKKSDWFYYDNDGNIIMSESELIELYQEGLKEYRDAVQYQAKCNLELIDLQF